MPGFFLSFFSEKRLTNAQNKSIITYMRLTSLKKKAGYRSVASRLRKELGKGMILEGSVCRVSAGAAHWHLTRKVKGRTTTLYIPDAEVEAVKEATARWREVRRLVKELGEEARRLLKEELAARSTATADEGHPRRRTGGRRSGS